VCVRDGLPAAVPDPDRVIDLARAVGALRRERLVVYPTETFYGVGAHALSDAAVRACADLKGRADLSPIAVIVADPTMLAMVVPRRPPAAEKLIARFWPGPLTLVLPARSGLPAELTAGTGMIGVRVSSHPTAVALSHALGAPITATSANRSGDPPARDVASATRAFGARIDVYVDGGTLGGGLGSTVLVVTDDVVRVVRPGAVPVEALRDVLGATPIL
jgi:L-threonylcarbamoyladenylate synthase